ncbi:MAG TPA: cupredoxin domain-containing protein [Anaerolineales bacterium]|nr:cupredoxin domain-containing protein [Anaerolineales bacterium]
MNRSWLLLLGVMLLLAACSGASTPQQVTVIASDFQYEPSTIEVIAGQTVHLTIQNTGSVDHDFGILEIPLVEGKVSIAGATPHPGLSQLEHEPALLVTVPKGQAIEVEFTPTQPGSYEIFCTVPGHKEAGMTGKLIVVSP